MRATPRLRQISSAMHTASGQYPRASPDAVRRLSEFGSCDVSDILMKLKVPGGGYVPDLEMVSPFPDGQDAVKIVGEAYTVRMVSTSDANAPKLSHHFADRARAGSVMVVSAPPHLKNACWGGLMTARAQHLGVQGVVIDGRCRDLSEHRTARFPVFARGHSTLGQATFVRASEVDVPVTIHPLTTSSGQDSSFPAVDIVPGSLIVADVDGVVVVPVELIEQVIEGASKSTSADAKVMADLREGSLVSEAFKRHRG